jgi:hypothetical protein
MRAAARIGDEYVKAEQYQQKKREQMKQRQHQLNFIAKSPAGKRLLQKAKVKR